MNKIFAKYGVSVTDLKKNMPKILKKAQEETVVVLNHNKPTAYLISAEMYEKLMEMIEEEAFEKMVQKRSADISNNKNLVDVDIDEL